MLIDRNQRLPNGAHRPTLCAYHANRLRAAVPAVDPEVLADELLTDIDSFTTADEVNLFLGNLVRQLARKRIARRDALALAYISQLILTSQSALHKEQAAQEESSEKANFAHLRRASQDLEARGHQQPDATYAEHAEDDPHRPA
jgi:hypothetical protein